MMKHLVRAGAGLLLLSLLSVSLLSCGDTAAPTSSEGNAPAAEIPASVEADAAGETTAAAEEDGLSLPDGLDFGGASCKFLIRSALAETEYFVEAETGEIVGDALYQRNLAVEERLNVSLEFIPLPGEWADRDSFNGAIRGSVMANDGAYDICGVLSNQLSTLALEGLLLNLSDQPYLDFSQEWWAKGLLDELTVGGRLYFVSGDASLGLLSNMMCVFYNKNLAADFGLPDLYQTVRDGEWTIDQIEELTKGVWLDLDGDGQKSHDDRLGFTVGGFNQLYGFIDSFDLPMIEKDADGVPTQFVFGDEKVVDAVSRLVTLFRDNDAMAVDRNFAYTTVFPHGSILFCTGEFNDTSSYREIDSFDYGVLPMPKWSEDQENYYTCLRANYSGFCLPATAQDPELSAAVLEAFAYESWKTVSPVYFEKALKVKYARDDETAQMFDLIRSSVTFKFGAAFTMSLGDPQNFFKNQVADLKENWSSAYAEKENVFQAALESTLETIRALP